MESLFGCNNAANPAPKEPPRKSVLPSSDQENRVLDPKKSQNIAILLRALNVTRDEVSEALLDGEFVLDFIFARQMRSITITFSSLGKLYTKWVIHGCVTYL